MEKPKQPSLSEDCSQLSAVLHHLPCVSLSLKRTGSAKRLQFLEEPQQQREQPLLAGCGAADSSISVQHKEPPPGHPFPLEPPIPEPVFPAVATCKAFPPAEHMELIKCRSMTTPSCSNSRNCPGLLHWPQPNDSPFIPLLQPRLHRFDIRPQ